MRNSEVVLPRFVIVNKFVARFEHILQPIADVCIKEDQKEHIDFDSFYVHTLCHECCHGIGPHTITLPSGQKSTVRLVRKYILNFYLLGLWNAF